MSEVSVTIKGTKFQIGDKVVSWQTVDELVKGENLGRKGGVPTYIVTMVRVNQQGTEEIKIDLSNSSGTKSAKDFTPYSELRNVVTKRIADHLLRMMSYDY